MENGKGGKITGEAGEYFIDWLGGLNPETAAHYVLHFEKFLGWLGMDAQSLYERHRDNLATGEPIRRMWLGKKVTEYMKHMRDELGYSIEGEASGTVLVVQKAVAGFLKSVGIEELPGRRSIKVRINEIPNIPRQDLAKVLNATGSFKNRAYIHFAKDSGLRTGDITNVTLGARGHAMGGGGMTLLEAIKDEAVEFFTFEWRQQKTGRKANPAIGPEALGALREWHRHRTETLGLPARNDDHLFCITRTRKGHTTSRGTEVKGVAAGERMSTSNMGTVFGQLVAKAGLKGTKASIHSLRKYHKTSLESGSCPTSWVNRLQGRKGDGTGGVYTKPDPTQLLEMYARSYNRLTIAEAGVSEERVQTLEEELAETRRAFETLKDATVGRMMRQLEAAGVDASKTPHEIAAEMGIVGEAETEQRVIEEEELVARLSDGWRFVSALNGTKVVVERGVG